VATLIFACSKGVIFPSKNTYFGRSINRTSCVIWGMTMRHDYTRCLCARPMPVIRQSLLEFPLTGSRIQLKFISMCIEINLWM
jgi:hypothetical protein